MVVSLLPTTISVRLSVANLLSNTSVLVAGVEMFATVDHANTVQLAVHSRPSCWAYETRTTDVN